MATHRPYVTKYVLVTDHWVVRCNCGLNEEHNDESSANARASEHAGGDDEVHARSGL